MPVLMVSENTCPHVGFSKNRSMEPSGRVMTIPNSKGSSIDTRPRVARAPRSPWVVTIAPRSTSVSTSPEMTRNGSSSSSAALRTEPAVPSGVSSVA